VWLEIVTLAHDLIFWTQALLHAGELAKTEPKKLRFRLLHVAARLGLPRPPREAPPPRHLALGDRAPRRIREAQSAPNPGRLTPTAAPHNAQQAAGSPPRSTLPATGPGSPRASAQTRAQHPPTP
jgi:hypothetical protein